MAIEKRRAFLKYALTAIVCGVVAGVGGFFAGSAAVPPPKTVTKTVTVTAPPITITKTVTPTPPREIVIGGTVAATGRFEGLCKPFMSFYKNWAEAINKRGGVYVEEYATRLPVRIIIYDDKSDIATAVKHYERLITVDKVDVLIGPFSSFLTIPVVSVVEKYGVPMVLTSANDRKIYEGEPEWIVGVLDFALKWSREYFTLLKEEGKAKTIAFIIEDIAHSKDVAEGSIKYAEDIGLKVLYKELIPKDVRDFTSTILEVKAIDPDIVYLSALIPPFTIAFMKQAVELGLNPREFHLAHVIKPVADALGVHINYVTTEFYWHPVIRRQGSKLFAELLEKTGITIDEYMDIANHMTAFQVIVAGIERAGTLDKAALNKAYHELHVMTVEGEVFFRQFGVGTANPFAVQVQDGKYIIIYPPHIATGKYVYPRPT